MNGNTHVSAANSHIRFFFTRESPFEVCKSFKIFSDFLFQTCYCKYLSNMFHNLYNGGSLWKQGLVIILLCS